MLSKIELQNFRNYKKYELTLANCTVLIGPNGVGKSNILEAVSFLSSCRSFRDDDKKNLINEECEFARIKSDNLEVFLTKVPRLSMQVKENGVVRKLSSFIGKIPTVVFSPETLEIITGAPQDRRKFLDIMISQVDREYLLSLVNYQKIRRQRNVLLQRIKEGFANPGELAFWDEEIINNAEYIYAKRTEAINYLNKRLTSLYIEISGKEESTLLLEYTGEDQNLRQAIKENESKEIAAGKTLFGPHRDDIVFKLNNRNAGNFASRGEIRSCVLALKIGELHFLEKNQNNSEMRPILLLDDVFSEFDEDRRQHLGNLVLKYQTLITTTDKEHLSEVLLKQAKVVEISQPGQDIITK